MTKSKSKNPNNIRIELTQSEYDALVPLVVKYQEASTHLIQQLARKQPKPDDTTYLNRWEKLDAQLGKILGGAIHRAEQKERQKGYFKR